LSQQQQTSKQANSNSQKSHFTFPSDVVFVAVVRGEWFNSRTQFPKGKRKKEASNHDGKENRKQKQLIRGNKKYTLLDFTRRESEEERKELSQNCFIAFLSENPRRVEMLHDLECWVSFLLQIQTFHFPQIEFSGISYLFPEAQQEEDNLLF